MVCVWRDDDGHGQRRCRSCRATACAAASTSSIPDRGLPFPQDLSRLKIELSRDGFADGRAITVDKALARIAFSIENRTNDAHITEIRVSLPEAMKYELRVNGNAVPLTQTGDWDYPWHASIAMSGTATVELVKLP